METPKPKKKLKLNVSKITKSLKYRPDIVRLINKLIEIIRRKDKIITKLKAKSSKQIVDTSCQSEPVLVEKKKPNDWTIQDDGNVVKDIVKQVKEVAEQALQETGMVYEETSGMYYDYKTGYYYNPASGLYYHGSTGCFYYYSEEKQEFIYHSHAHNLDKYGTSNTSSKVKRKHKKETLESDGKRKKKRKEITVDHKENYENNDADAKETKDKTKKEIFENNLKNEAIFEEIDSNKEAAEKEDGECDSIREVTEKEDGECDSNKELIEKEDGECSASDEEGNNDDKESSSSENESSSFESEEIADQAPCIRLVVKETNIPNLSIGSLFLVTKLGGSLGREGDQHCVLLKDENISRMHLEFKYDESSNDYSIVDLGSRNGTYVDGKKLSKTSKNSEAVKVLHGSTLQVAETKLLCHIHKGLETCGHCEPGLIMDKPKPPPRPYRTTNVKKQHQLELARLKNKYKPKPPLAITAEGEKYKDRAMERRNYKGSSHSAHKTQQSDLNTEIEPTNKGFQMLKNMGWSKGEGLGKTQTGTTAPVPLIANRGSSGLGSDGLVKVVSTPADIRLVKPKLLKPARAFLDALDDDEP